MDGTESQGLEVAGWDSSTVISWLIWGKSPNASVTQSFDVSDGVTCTCLAGLT